uniref:Uncharacterized protein n=1 Tax=Timema tahoe TaxID=61484 RepID=A0A7R9FN63_9NEOP|nr:unnamed protein product [Timema tahoe]
MCVVCGEVLSNESLKQNKLKRDLEIKHRLISATFPRRTADLKSGEQTKVLLMSQAADLCRGLAENWSPLAVGHLDLRRWQRRLAEQIFIQIHGDVFSKEDNILKIVAEAVMVKTNEIRGFSPISSFNFVTSAADSDDFFLNVFDFERRVKLFLFSASNKAGYTHAKIFTKKIGSIRMVLVSVGRMMEGAVVKKWWADAKGSAGAMAPTGIGGTCGYHEKFNQLAERIQTTIPTADVSGKEGRRVNCYFVHSDIHVNDILLNLYNKLWAQLREQNKVNLNTWTYTYIEHIAPVLDLCLMDINNIVTLNKDDIQNNKLCLKDIQSKNNNSTRKSKKRKWGRGEELPGKSADAVALFEGALSWGNRRSFPTTCFQRASAPGTAHDLEQKQDFRGFGPAAKPLVPVNAVDVEYDIPCEVDDVNDIIEAQTPHQPRGRGRPRVVRTGSRGRPRKIYHPGSFEVQVNGQLIHSKLSTMAFPDFTNVIDIVGDAAQGKEVKSVSVQQPITDCDIM